MAADTKIDEEIRQLSKDLADEDDLGAVIRGHIRIENLLSRYLESIIPKPRHLEGARLDYYKRTSLALALGMREELKGPLRSLGKIRNDFAHAPNTSLLQNHYVDFISSFSRKDKEVFDKTIKEMTRNQDSKLDQYTHKDHFRIAILTLWMACRLQVRAVEESSLLTQKKS